MSKLNERRLSAIRAVAKELRQDRGRSPEYAMKVARRYADMFVR